MKILLIEDEVKLAEYLRKGLGEASYVVDIAYNGVDGLHMALEGSYDLLVLDAMLPGIDGFSLLTAFRKTKQTPVLMLTARAASRIGYWDSRRVPTTIWSSPLRFPN